MYNSSLNLKELSPACASETTKLSCVEGEFIVLNNLFK